MRNKQPYNQPYKGALWGELPERRYKSNNKEKVICLYRKCSLLSLQILSFYISWYTGRILEHLNSPPVVSGVWVAKCLVFCVVFCTSFFSLFSVLFWPLYCQLPLLITSLPLVSSRSPLHIVNFVQNGDSEVDHHVIISNKFMMNLLRFVKHSWFWKLCYRVQFTLCMNDSLHRSTLPSHEIHTYYFRVVK